MEKLDNDDEGGELQRAKAFCDDDDNGLSFGGQIGEEHKSSSVNMPKNWKEVDIAGGVFEDESPLRRVESYTPGAVLRA